jgi:hypothetical protein
MHADACAYRIIRAKRAADKSAPIAVGSRLLRVYKERVRVEPLNGLMFAGSDFCA